MKKNKNNLISKFFVIGLFVLLSMNVYPYINCNGGGKGYDGDGGDGIARCSEGGNISIENLIAEGGGYYLRANSDVQTFLSMYEFQNMYGIDFDELNNSIDSAIANIKNAIDTYDALIDKAEKTPYDESIQAMLSSFNYNTFMEENGLNSIIFEEVKSYLKVGDITGIFKKVHSDFKNILEILDGIKLDISQDKLPDVSITRELNERFSEMSIFGSYVAKIFTEINR
jgi:hypothetical protein